MSPFPNRLSYSVPGTRSGGDSWGVSPKCPRPSLGVLALSPLQPFTYLANLIRPD